MKVGRKLNLKLKKSNKKKRMGHRDIYNKVNAVDVTFTNTALYIYDYFFPRENKFYKEKIV